jgi:glutamate decarboxylase
MRAKQYIIPNYPLPPNEEKTEILRVVVRESMSFDLLDRLIADLCAVTQTLLESDPGEVSFLQGGSNTTLEKQFSVKGEQHQAKHHKGQGHQGKRPMSEGVHRTVC